MKYTTVYKVLNNNLTSWCPPSGLALTYEPYKWTKPWIKGSHLFAYKSIADVKAFHFETASNNDYIKVFVARAVVVTDIEDNFMLALLHKRTTELCSSYRSRIGEIGRIFPNGTIACSRIKILEQLHEDYENTPTNKEA